MRIEAKRLLAVAITASALLAVPALAAKDKKKTADTMVTVYVSAHGGTSMASKINETHVIMEAQGWRFADMEIHSENADTEGALVTYVK